jgi:hypothetical protein
MKKSAIGLFLFLMLFAAACAGGPEVAETPGEKPKAPTENYDQTGFRDVPWLTDISTVSNLEPSHQAGSIDIYIRKGDALVVKDRRFENVFYGFYSGRFCAAAVTFDRPGDAEALYEYIASVFGEPVGTLDTPEGEIVNLWDGVLVEVTLVHKEAEGTLRYRYKPVFKEIGEL